MKKLICAVALSCIFVPTYSFAGAVDTTTSNVINATTINPDLEAVKGFYTLLSNQDTDAAVLQQHAAAIVDVNWKKFPGSLAEQGLVGFANTFAQYHQAIPNMTWTPKNIYKSGNNYTVRCIGTGTPVFDFLGTGLKPGNSFKIQTIDIHRVENGKIVHTFHVEDWQTASAQLKP